MDSKSRELKRAYNTVTLLPEDYPKKYELKAQIEDYADECDIDLGSVTGY